MDVFHLVIDTSMLRRNHFRHANFERLLQCCLRGLLKIYIPRLVLEEERTHQLTNHQKAVAEIDGKFGSLQRGMLGMLVEGLPAPHLKLWDFEAVTRNSQEIFGRFVAYNRIEVIEISIEQALQTWQRYFNVDPPFNPNEKREDRRRDIPDAWILEAGIEIKSRDGRHCALVGDNKLSNAFVSEGLAVYDDIEALLSDIEQATAVIPIPQAEQPRDVGSTVSLDQLRSLAFQGVDVVVLGTIEALDSPTKEQLFSVLERAGYDRAIVEHEARTLVLSHRLNDTGAHFVPTSRVLAKQAAATEAVINVLLKVTS